MNSAGTEMLLEGVNSGTVTTNHIRDQILVYKQGADLAYLHCTNAVSAVYLRENSSTFSTEHHWNKATLPLATIRRLGRLAATE